MSVNGQSHTGKARAVEPPTGSVPASGRRQINETRFPPSNVKTRLRARIREDEQMMQLFGRFQDARWDLSDRFVRSRIIRPSHFSFGDRERPFNAMVFDSMAEDFTRGLLGEVNRFLINVHQADSWVRAINSCEKAKRPGLFWEFADPMLELSVSRPYSLKNQLVFAAAHLIHQANLRTKQNWKDDLPADNRIDFKLLARIGAGWIEFPEFLGSLEKLNDEKFRRLTRNFRHLLQHRFRLQLGEGLTTYFDRQRTANGTSYTYRVFRPLQVNNLIPKLYKQHQRSAEAFLGYWRLVKELSASWPEKKLKGDKTKSHAAPAPN